MRCGGTSICDAVFLLVPGSSNVARIFQRSQGAVHHLKRSAKRLMRAVQCGSVRGLEWALRERQPCRCLAASPAKNQTTASMQLRRRSGEKSDGEKTSRMLVPLLVIA